MIRHPQRSTQSRSSAASDVYKRQAQNYTEVVYLKNGSIIKGVIIEQVPNVSLKIKTGDGSLIICQMSDVTKITKEERYTRDYRKDTNDRKAARNTLKGYKGFVDFAYIGDVSDYNASKIELSTTHGYQFNNYFFVGGGVAFNYYTDADLYAAPIYACLLYTSDAADDLLCVDIGGRRTIKKKSWIKVI